MNASQNFRQTEGHNNYNSNGDTHTFSSSTSRLGFQAARANLSNYNRRGNINNNENGGRTGGNPTSSKTLGMKRKFKPPRMEGSGSSVGGYQQNGGGRSTRQYSGRKMGGGWNNGGVSGAINAANKMNSNMYGGGGGGGGNDCGDKEEADIPERLKGIDPKLIEAIENDIIGSRINVKWEDIAGLDFAKRTCQEIVVLPIISPHLFSGLRRLPKGLLLFGPPGTGKTMIGKAIAAQSGATFFSISASSLTSKWIGQVSQREILVSMLSFVWLVDCLFVCCGLFVVMQSE